MIRDLVLWPDPRLLEPAVHVRVFDAELVSLARDMVETMERHRGCGLAAVQVGVPLSLIVLNYGPRALGQSTLRIMANPRIVRSRGELVLAREDCLSCPGAGRLVDRASIVDVAWDPITPESGPSQERFRGWAARIVAHEIDHLEGRVIAS